MLSHFFGRLILIPLALTISFMTALTLISFIGLQKIERLIDYEQKNIGSFFLIWESFNTSSPLIPHLMFVPILAVVLIGEIFHFRSLLYYAVGFGLSLGLFALALPELEWGIHQKLFQNFWQIFSTAGFAAGLAYWLVAGRSA